MILHKNERKLLKLLEGKGRVHLEKAAPTGEVDALRRAAFWLQGKGLAEAVEVEEKGYVHTGECERYLEGGFPEVKVAGKDGVKVSELSEEERKVGVMWAVRNKWVEVKGGVVKRLKEPGKYALVKAAENPEKASDEEVDVLFKRGLLRESSKKRLFVKLTEKGEKEAGKVEVVEELGEITHEMIVGGGCKGKKFAPYAVAPAADAPMGKMHPLSRQMEKIRGIFAEMGFEEMGGSIVQSAFWNFDALFCPQDHPARDLADTFYLEGKAKLPEKKLVEKVKESHEKGWKYKWSREEAERVVLRTHTTPLSAQYLHKMKKNSGKYFAVGRVFRNEATDFKHLAEFIQVEGIVAWEGATFGQLMGILKEFYRKLGFEKVRFRPSYFPYTEPSLEVEVYFEEKEEWIELGGAGVFRPEMTKPLCDVYPVLAWGLSLERPMILKGDMKDIRTFYRNELDWLKSSRVKG